MVIFQCEGAASWSKLYQCACMYLYVRMWCTISDDIDVVDSPRSWRQRCCLEKRLSWRDWGHICCLMVGMRVSGPSVEAQCYCRPKEPSFSPHIVLCSKELHVIHSVASIMLSRIHLFDWHHCFFSLVDCFVSNFGVAYWFLFSKSAFFGWYSTKNRFEIVSAFVW